ARVPKARRWLERRHKAIAIGFVNSLLRPSARLAVKREAHMASNGKGNHQSYLYAGLAGETGPGRVVDSGLFRLADGSSEWERLERGLPDKPAVRALAVHPLKPEIIYAGTQAGPYRSGDRGKHWEKVELPDHGLPVWSILFHPHNPDVI